MQRRGYLDVIAVTGTDKDKKAPKRWVVLNLEGVCLDQYDSEYFETTGSIRCSVSLKNCRHIEASKSSPYTFEFTSNIGCYRFGCGSREEVDGWVEDIRRAVAQERIKSYGGSDSPSNARVQPKLDASGSPSTSGAGTFSVTLKQNQVAKRLRFTGKYSLRITLKNISLYEEESDVRVATWAYDQLRKFTAYKNRIEVEAGRRSETGPGEYIFLTPRGEEISQLMTSNIKRIDEKIKRINAAASEKEKSKVPHDPFENPCYVDNPLLLMATPALLEKDGGSKVPRENVNIPYLIDSPATHHRQSLNDTPTAARLGTSTSNHDYEEVELVQTAVSKRIESERQYAKVEEPHDLAVKEQHDHLVADYIPMQCAGANALSLIRPLKGNDVITSPKHEGERIYAKLKKPPKPPKPSAIGTVAMQSSHSGAAAPGKEGVSLVNSHGWEDFDDDPEYMQIKPNLSYAPASCTIEQPQLDLSSGGVSGDVSGMLPAPVIVPAVNKLSSAGGVVYGGAASTAADDEYAGHLEEIDRMWNEAWNT